MATGRNPSSGGFLKPAAGQTAQIEFNIVLYKGSKLIADDLISGQIDIGLVPFFNIRKLVEESLKILFTNGHKRIPQLRNVQAVAERFPGFHFRNWYGLAAPALTPEPIAQCLRAELVKFARSPDFVALLEDLGVSATDEPENF